ncbi:Sfi1 spindle body protein-domain-containing protein [Massariosphaeria phaeospora]|uniref:Sfi1 spindle body protein-domain-containing protein n=1 Tax=Massariosphaeria phaeospora TaxID=100035 RepID=A0A7C8MDC6_9PLEO|nr:Sfi1 spindle body protein-domain-containing protein [Massariosphaeria phaeospora]
MPSPMSAANHDTPDLRSDYIADRTIEVLYEIVRRAQSAHPRSSRALFDAYQDILAERNLQPRDDSVVQDFLVRLHEDSTRKDESLVERFKRTLADQRIFVEFDPEGEGIERTSNVDTAPLNGGPSTQNALERKPERRGSLDSFFDGSADKVAGTDAGQELPVRSEHASRGALAGAVDRRQEQRRSRSDTDAQLHVHGELPIRNRVNGHGNHRATSEQQPPNHRRNGSVSSRGSLQIQKNGQVGALQHASYDADDSEHTAQTHNFDLDNIRIPGVNAPIPGSDHEATRELDYEHTPEHVQHFAPEPYRPTDTQLIDNAETLEQRRLHSLARACIQTWRDRRLDHAERRQGMENVAYAFDRRVSLKIIIDHWQNKLRMVKSGQETERFFGRLETRAQKARDLFLLTKAFTHWARSAEDGVQRTAVAKRHLLRSRVFNGWRDITAVNEMKIQHFVLGKFLRKWRERLVGLQIRSIDAVGLHEDNLRSKYWKLWLLRYRSDDALHRQDMQLKSRVFHKWHTIVSQLKTRENLVVDDRCRAVLAKLINGWKQKAATLQGLEARAGDFRRTSLLSSAFRTVRKQAQLAPLLAQSQAKANQHIAGTALQTWRHNARLSRQATNLDRMRILQNAWTTWNDRLRIKFLEAQINDRVQVDALRRWTLASRVKVFQRVHDRSLKESTFLTWVTKTNSRHNTLESAERRFAEFKRTQLLRIHLKKIEDATVQRKADAFAAASIYENKMKARVFERLLEKHNHFQQLKEWAGNAHYYVCTKRALKIWNEATQHARRNRRREAYTQVRRMVKMHLVRRAFATWRQKANELAEQQRQANDMLENRVVRTSISLLAQWHDRTAALREKEDQAAQQYNSKLIVQSLTHWTQRMESLHTMDTQAVALRQESTEIVASSCFKKLGWKLWNMQRQEETALALQQRNFEKRVRAMIRFWLEQAVERLANRPVSPTPSSRHRGGAHRDEDHDHAGDGPGGDGDPGPADSPDFDSPGDETRRLEHWTAFDEGALGLSNLDLSLTVSPPRQPPTRLPRPQPPAPPPPRSALRRPPPPAIPEEALDLNDDDDDAGAFWTSTPMPPPTTHKPGYLKTPSKRSVMRSKRPELPASPEKRVVGLERGLERGVMSAPPGVGARRDGGGGVGAGVGGRHGGVTSFERRLREGVL